MSNVAYAIIFKCYSVDALSTFFYKNGLFYLEVWSQSI
ncbi:Hypothetical protein I595_1775 [Croceitalea dokdonensis DOKDO 023]|uniref:Uncharacterized protein n=1 Tax=Croceitalea dokdonensis DOKDO 023 TaxID=1300341 RepID=A0A0P7AJW5_9FLAO|nr:Hypothetical protein I595_1775 [Croceitalea dokdonensis DOKDO 023]